MKTTDLSNPLTLNDIEQSRNDAIALYTDSLAMRHAAAVQFTRTTSLVAGLPPSNGDTYTPATVDESRLTDSEALAAFTRSLDIKIWQAIYTRLNLNNIMDAQARREFSDDLHNRESVMPATADNIRATYEGLQSDSFMMFQRGLVNAFSKLDRRFKSHDGFKIGSRIILNGNSQVIRETLNDVERIFYVLDGHTPVTKYDETCSHKIRRTPHGAVMETDYFRIRRFKKGTIHIWFMRADLVRRANLLLADYYGEQIGKGSEVCDPADLGPDYLPTIHKELGYYPTPVAVINRMLDLGGYPSDGDRVLEPSCGTGAIIKVLLSHNEDITIDAFEYDADRATTAAIRYGNKARIVTTDFLFVTPDPTYDYIYMNPPFNKGRDIDHVTHALKFLKPGGRLIAVMSARAALSHNKRHEVFRTRLMRHYEPIRTNWNGPQWFVDLPERSFAKAGTNVNTVLLAVKRPLGDYDG